MYIKISIYKFYHVIATTNTIKVKNAIMGKSADVDEMKRKLKMEFGTVEDGQLRKLLGIRYKWMRTIEGRPYVVMSMDDKGANIVRAYEKLNRNK